MEIKMKNLILAASIIALGTGSAMAGNMFGDGSPANNYVLDQHGHAISQEQVKNVRYFYRGDGSVEDSYYAGRHLNSPISRTGVPAAEMKHFGDGSPVNQGF